MSYIFIVLGIAGAAYGLLLVHIYRSQDLRLYRPQSEIVTTPAEHGFAYEGVKIRTVDGLLLDAWYVPHTGARRVLLFLHGNTRNISHCMESIAIFHRLGFNTLLFDYRGYGQSDGRPSEQGTYYDAEAAWNYLVGERGFPPADIVVLGRSLGAAIASHLGTLHAPCALVIESTFTALADLAAEMHPWVPVRWLSRHRYPVCENIAAVRCPVLVVHGRDDELIPFHHGRSLYDAVPGAKGFLEIGGSHYDGFLTTGESYVAGLAGFLDRHCAAR
jgi:pimeloyl-ACP methyl ester carboxylesterase